MKKSKIYTRTGDTGQTKLGCKLTVEKDHKIVITLGAIDELNCIIGIILSDKNILAQINQVLIDIQKQLFDMGAEISGTCEHMIQEKHIALLETQIDTLDAQLPPLSNFILPGGNSSAAHCHLARAVCRRAETHLVALQKKHSTNKYCLQYLNRLSDYLFVCARILNKAANINETTWQVKPRNP